MIRSILYLSCSILFLMSCQQDGAVNTAQSDKGVAGITKGGEEVVEEISGISKEEAEKIVAEREREKAAERAQNLPGFRAHAKELVKVRAQKEKAMAFMTSDHWAYEFVFDGSEMSKKGQYTGQWIKYEDDHTYTYGLGDKVNGSGQYHYSLDTEKMIMVDDKEDMMPEEWEIKAQDEVMIMVGAGYFGNNPRQCKMLRWNGRPMPAAAAI